MLVVLSATGPKRRPLNLNKPTLIQKKKARAWAAKENKKFKSTFALMLAFCYEGPGL
jgi:hypothetical protein